VTLALCSELRFLSCVLVLALCNDSSAAQSSELRVLAKDPYSANRSEWQQGGSAATAPQPQQPPGPDTTGQQNPCIQPTRFLIPEQYTGPMRKVVQYFARKPEIKTVQGQRRDSGSRICALPASAKFHLFVKNSIHPVTFIAAGFYSGIAQAEDDDPSFGQGSEGYGRRYGAALADQVSGDFFHTFVYPVIFRQDPRYYRQGYGSGRSRLGHAVTHVFVAHADSGGSMFNFSEWLGTVSSVALSNTYHPGNRRGAGPASESIAVSIGSDAGFDILREFWPEVVRKFKLPFRVDKPPHN
jgi:hypothetical protein